jgi:DNA-directed RNA polymerase subunit RPC12/RpoP
MAEKKEMRCKQCGVTLVTNCPVIEEDLCEKKKAITCPNCEYVELDENEPIKCTYPKA